MDNEGFLVKLEKAPFLYPGGSTFYSVFMENKSQKPWWQPGLIVFAEVTGWIAVPIIIALFLGRYLDEKYNSEPWFFLGLTGVAFIISCTGMVVVAGKYIKQIEKESKKKLIKDKKLIKEEKLTKNKKDEPGSSDNENS